MRAVILSSVMVVTLAVTVPAAADAPAAPEGPASSKEAAPAAAAAPAPAPASAKDSSPKESAPSKEATPTPAPAPAKDSSPKEAAPKPAATKEPAPAPAKEAAPAPAKEVAPAPAKEVAPPPAAPPAAAEPAPPALALRETRPITLAAEPAPLHWIYKLGFAGVIAAAGVVAWRRRKQTAGKSPARDDVRVLSRTSFGLRGELAVVEVRGLKLLVGVTASSMQTLAIVPEEEGDAGAEATDEASRAVASPSPSSRSTPAARTDDLAARARSLFAQLELRPPAKSAPPPLPAPASYAAARYADEAEIDSVPESAPAPPRAKKTRAPRRRTARELASATEDVEGQAMGIAASLGSRR